ncbi:hypothetical protein GCM10018793_16820 [Streptomyces sulfonofaciens]|uniref:Sterol-binding protein n=1 Tax=Streptomyces sulfonofaciens TaxID=68272 RepID=A0A919KW93_9ACTN|nr:sterol-binding protein [Streptomyces sulfonofaciens]GHH74877.1 hypothetical protein GCM10018793_16820 [Streptomyces sulfonofaciens]
MATIQECRAALDKLAERLDSADGEVRRATAVERSVSCHITDLDTTFSGCLTDGRIEVQQTAPGPPVQRAQIRLAMTGDDLVALVAGELGFPGAWASGRVRLEAGILDLLRLKSLL